jgi:hypothetical protein
MRFGHWSQNVGLVRIGELRRPVGSVWHSPVVIELSTYVFERLREDGELVLYRGRSTISVHLPMNF